MKYTFIIIIIIITLLYTEKTVHISMDPLFLKKMQRYTIYCIIMTHTVTTVKDNSHSLQ